MRSCVHLAGRRSRRSSLPTRTSFAVGQVAPPPPARLPRLRRSSGGSPRYEIRGSVRSGVLEVGPHGVAV